MKNVALHTLGCKVNYSETSTIGRQFVERGYRIVSPEQPCDIYVLNTCSVTERADKECRQIIRRMLRHSPNAYVVVVGCYAQLQPGQIASIEGVDLVLGAKEKFNIFEHADDFRKGRKTQIYVSCIDEPLDFIPSSSGDVEGRTRAFLKVQDGCDYSCTFCTIPLARGKSRSLPVDELLKQGRTLAGNGYREIVLTGVNIGDYGSQSETSFFDLLKSLEELPVDRLRISSIEPNLLTKEMVDYLLASEKYCNHFHIPLQSGNDAVLKKMRRRYLRDHYRELVEYIKTIDPDAGIGADVLVGFPGETEAAFNDTYSFLVDLPISYLHVFTYSEREKTPAIEYADPVDMHERHRRNEMLRILSLKKRQAFASTFLGRSLPVLFETAGEYSNKTGLTRNYLRVETNSEIPQTNEIHEVRITGVYPAHCSGDILTHTSIAHRHGELIHTQHA
jgi:threonylcarbamoyladenosine tRNA methylthiotransferase MtaB